MSSIPMAIRQQVISEAEHRCEYCLTSSRLIGMPLVIDHIMPKSLGGGDERENIAASCYRCNEFKGARIQGVDPETDELTMFFNPRKKLWIEHFAWINGATQVIGVTATGRVTATALRVNNEYIVATRGIWAARGWHPPY
ncbi:hypothetical protein APA_3732 [Pseudanabaena sp. lw0831]|uniref:HNH endonuclease n=1 Tax=Pseudanabaena sp. lw0831 TaxID=1357935 RepID=UPI001915D5E0|nr:HNH endonuclease [Pseudanabaena sp. lw0831]GBO55581.1 hypothetical protein APA_3732 [Pseudanabaena sp. lw0831]